MKPDFRIVIDGHQDVTDLVRDRFISLSVTDEAGRQSDSVELRLDDRKSAIDLPRKGAKMKVFLGYGGQDYTETGEYTVDEIALAGPPSTVAIRARGADFRAELKAQKTRSWDDVTLGDLVGRIASDHGLKPRVGSALRSVRIPHLDQTEESDLNLLTRLARDHDAVAKPAGGYLLFVPQGGAESATGRPMPVIDVRPEDVSSWEATLADRGEYRSARARWHDPEKALEDIETAGSGNPAYTLQGAYASAGEAREAARAKLAALLRGTARLTLALSPGNPVVAAEAKLRLSRFRDGVDGSWTCRRVVHRLDRGGYSTRVDADTEKA